MKSAKGSRKEPRRRGFLVIKRLLRDGRVDTRFGNRGQIVTRFSKARKIFVDSTAFDPQGRLLVSVGSLTGGGPPGTGAVLMRYLLDS